jgi:metal-dependent amidase/aminoacylase/carboxypeptidase family protein
VQAEENGGGKVDLLKAGLYKPVDISLMCHPTGNFDGCYFPIIAISSFEVEFFGKSAHAAMAPWNGINALDAMIQVFNSVNGLRQSLRPRTMVSGIISDGGKAPGLIP